jgi:hypothetical protein
MCKQLAENDINRWQVNALLNGYYGYNELAERMPLAALYEEIIYWLGCEERGEDFYEFPIEDASGQQLDLHDIIDLVDEWIASEPLQYDYKVVDMYGEKVPLMELAPYIGGWCDSMISRMYDMCYGILDDMGKNVEKGGVREWIQSPALEHSNSIKHVLPAALKEYSSSEDLLISEGLPSNGYEGLRAMGNIARGDECTTIYLRTLNREPIDVKAPGHAPFDANIEAQCLRYCRLDTLSMVVIYLAVIEATERWANDAYTTAAQYVWFEDDDLLHSIVVDTENQVFYKECDEYFSEPYDYDYEVEIISEATLQNMDVREQYATICPKCRRLRNTGSLH